MKNIQIGNESIIEDIAARLTAKGTERRLQRWAVGEIFITSSEVIPNARRDGFEDNQAWVSIKNDIQKVARTVVKTIRSASTNRNKLKNVTTIIDETRARIDENSRSLPRTTARECTHSREGGSKSVKTLLDKIAAIREEVLKAVQAHYGRDKKLKVKFAIATRNIDWRGADRTRAGNAEIPIITEDDLSYFNRLTDILKTAARYQFLGRYFEGEKVEGLRLKVPATQGRVGKKTFYNFLISPHDLLRICYISHMAKSSNDDLESYQRMVKPSRLNAIGRYIDEGGTFPTNIVVNFKRENLPFDRKESFGDTSTGTLSLPGQYGAAWVIDGQHRLYGYACAILGVGQRSSITFDGCNTARLKSD